MDEEKRRLQLDKNFKRIQALERRFPRVRKVTQHPKYGHWIPVAMATGEVVIGLFLLGLLMKLISLIVPQIPWPDISIPLPDINLPRIPFPHIPLPNLPDFPELPEWLKTTLYWLKKTWPIWIAVAFALYETKKKGKKDGKPSLDRISR